MLTTHEHILFDQIRGSIEYAMSEFRLHPTQVVGLLQMNIQILIDETIRGMAAAYLEVESDDGIETGDTGRD
jgi:hypothetical protein